MRKKSIIFLNIFILVSGVAYSQIKSDTLIVDKSYENSYKKPILAKYGTIIINQTDSLYLVNDLRFRYYEKLRMTLKDSLEITLDDIIFKYEKLIKENETAYNNLLENCNQTGLLNQEIITNTETSLDKTIRNIDSTLVSIEKANQSLDKTEKLLKKSKNKQNAGKLTFGIGGIAIGFFIGILLF